MLFLETNTITSISNLTKTISKLTLFPNPSTSQLFIKLTSKELKSIKLKIHDNIGNVVFDKNYALILGENTIDLNINNLAKGIYFLVRFDDFTNETVKFIKN